MRRPGDGASSLPRFLSSEARSLPRSLHFLARTLSLAPSDVVSRPSKCGVDTEARDTVPINRLLWMP